MAAKYLLKTYKHPTTRKKIHFFYFYTADCYPIKHELSEVHWPTSWDNPTIYILPLSTKIFKLKFLSSCLFQEYNTFFVILIQIAQSHFIQTFINITSLKLSQNEFFPSKFVINKYAFNNAITFLAMLNLKSMYFH